MNKTQNKTQIQICINRFKLPEDSIYIIKCFLWYDLEYMQIKRLKDKIHNKINRAIRRFAFDDTTCRWIFQTNNTFFNCVFCLQCGNYIEADLTRSLCSCK